MILKQDVQNDVTSLNTKNVYLPFKQLVTREWCNPPNLSFRANGHTKVKVQFSRLLQITRWSVHKYIHNVTKVMCALYIRCALSVLPKECRKVWGARYTLGTRYRSENMVIHLPHTRVQEWWHIPIPVARGMEDCLSSPGQKFSCLPGYWLHSSHMVSG